MEVTWLQIRRLANKAKEEYNSKLFVLCQHAENQSYRKHPRRYKAFREVERIILDADAASKK